MDYNEQVREEAYKQRIGKVYGVWKVIGVEYAQGSYNKQEWTVQCVKCGRVKKIKYGKELVKGRTGNWCTCMKKKRTKEPAPSYEDKMQAYVGKTYGRWRVLGYEAHKGMLVECLDCGRRCYHPATKVFENRTQCTCQNVAKYDESYIGTRYGHLVVRSITHKKMGKDNRLVFDCICDCGNSRLARPVYLEQGSILCCGNDCKFKNESTKLPIGSSKESLYVKWHGMIQRCYNEKSVGYVSYGGRGITVCDEWKNDYGAFREWALNNGFEEGLSIDRIDPDGNYEPYNCRFIPLSENTKLARKGRYTVASNFTKLRHKGKYNDVKVKLADGYETDVFTACDFYGIKYKTALYRVEHKGMTWEEAIKTALLVGADKFKGLK